MSRGPWKKKLAAQAEVKTNTIKREDLVDMLRFGMNPRNPAHLAAYAEHKPADVVKTPDPVNHPQHYTTGGIECIDYIKQVMTPQEFIGYLRGNAIKYQHRLMLKGVPSENADKARWYTERLVKELKELEK